MTIHMTFDPPPPASPDDPINVSLRPNDGRFVLACPICGCNGTDERVMAWFSADHLGGAICPTCLRWGPGAWGEMLRQRAVVLEANAAGLRAAAARPWFAPSHDDWLDALEAER